MTGKLHLNDRPLALAEFAAAARGPLEITLAPAVRERLGVARGIVDCHTAGDRPIYGLNTGLGANLRHRIGAGEMAAFQSQLLEGRRVGVGEPLPEEVARAALLARIVGAARGGAGLSTEVLDLMIAMAGRGLAPVIPSRGSIGAGDLVLGVEIGATLLGKGQIWVGGKPTPAARALAEAGLAPASLKPKDALALANHSAVTVALAGLAVDRARRLIDLAMAVAALSAEGYGANLSIFDPRLQELRPAAGQAAAAAWFRRAFEGSSLASGAAARSIQDPLSFRTMAPLFGAARAALATATGEIETELNGIADSPVVLVEAGEMLSTPNFHTPAMALALDTLSIADLHIAAASAQRIVKLMTPQLSDLPKYLSPVGGASAGMVPMQKTAAALLGEIRLYAQPASLDVMAVSDMVEDVAPQTPLAARKLASQLEALRLLIGIEAVVAAQAIDLRRPAAMGWAAGRIHRAVRSAVATLESDRAIGVDVAAALAQLETAALADQLATIDRG